MKFIRIGENDAKKYDALIKEMPALIKIYSPSCHYCQEMQKDWDALEKDKSLKDYAIAIVEILVDASDEIKSPSGKVTNGIPTIRAVKKNGDKWVDYNGERSTSEMAKFIKQQFISQKRLLNKSSSLSEASSSRTTARTPHAVPRIHTPWLVSALSLCLLIYTASVCCLSRTSCSVTLSFNTA